MKRKKIPQMAKKEWKVEKEEKIRKNKAKKEDLEKKAKNMEMKRRNT